MNFSRQHRAFVTKWAPKDDDARLSEFLDDLRVVIVEAQFLFRHQQKTGQFTDNTGDKFLALCKTHDLDPTREA